MRILCAGYFGDNLEFVSFLKARFPEVEFIESFDFDNAVWVAQKADIILLSNILPSLGISLEELVLLKKKLTRALKVWKKFEMEPEIRDISRSDLKIIDEVYWDSVLKSCEEKSKEFSLLVKHNSKIPVFVMFPFESASFLYGWGIEVNIKNIMRFWNIERNYFIPKMVWYDIFKVLEREILKVQ